MNPPKGRRKARRFGSDSVHLREDFFRHHVDFHAHRLSLLGECLARIVNGKIRLAQVHHHHHDKISAEDSLCYIVNVD